MQEEVNDKTVALVVRASKLTDNRQRLVLDKGSRQQQLSLKRTQRNDVKQEADCKHTVSIRGIFFFQKHAKFNRQHAKSDCY